MYVLLLIVHLLVCLGLVCVVLLQSGKGGGLAGGAFGGTAQTVFGGRGATDFMTRATMVLGAAFFITSITLALMSGSRGGGRSLIQEDARRSSSTSATPTSPARTPAGTGTPSTAPAPLTPAAPAPAPAGGK